MNNGQFAGNFSNVISDHETVKTRENPQRLFPGREPKQVNKGGNPEYFGFIEVRPNRK